LSTTELTIDPAHQTYNTMQDITASNNGGSDFFVKNLVIQFTLADGSSGTASFEITKVGSAFVGDITDKTGDYTVTIDKA
jgi:hypothetical protein